MARSGSVLGGSTPGGRLMLNLCTILATMRYIITLAKLSPGQLRRPEKNKRTAMHCSRLQPGFFGHYVIIPWCPFIWTYIATVLIPLLLK